MSPVYVYRCPTCGKRIEEMHGMDEKAKILCEHYAPFSEVVTHRAEMQRVISAPAHFDLRGPGFYCNDYGSG